MALKISHFVFIALWLSLVLLLFHELYNLTSKINNKQSSSSHGNIIIAYSSQSKYPFINRKVLASKFDFTPFQRNHHDDQKQQHDKKSSPDDPKKVLQPAPETQIDPRYGVEKRLVPTGPNPLHH
ncbi:hypothetical protein Ddye_030671 [Dipteronia dyeriana]|uniref:CLAVATA3/ESR (CLE)-related protein 12-like n=1 Tax=Dipteronia dyeriana TaxID=168575 RepID=A0AAD9WLN4_9ROSI|nr:hypothetical protein Ddye_030671 [Dipteronia dyeriana]